MTLASIVGKFAMDLGDTPPDRDSWFLDYVLRSPKHAGRHLTAGWLALQSLTEIYESHEIGFVQEFFGGMGAQALMVQDLWTPAEHMVQEYSLEAVAHLERVLPYPHRVNVQHVDAYDPLDDPAFYHDAGLSPDLVVLDFGDLTAWKTRDGEQHRELLDRVFAREPKAVVFTDIACRYLHLHRERYEGLLGAGTCESYPTYLGALLARLQGLYGYSLHRGFHDRWSTVMALVPSDGLYADALLPTPDEPVGLELF